MTEKRIQVDKTYKKQGPIRVVYVIAIIFVLFLAGYGLFQQYSVRQDVVRSEIASTVFAEDLHTICEEEPSIKEEYPRACSIAEKYLLESKHTQNIFGPPSGPKP